MFEFSTQISLVWALVACTGVAVVVYLIGFVCAFRHTAARPGGQHARVASSPVVLPPLTVLKPLKGEEEALEQNLRSVLAQDYPGELHIVFASSEADDPALAIARDVARAFPHRDVTFTVSRHAFGRNPKVQNLAGALAVARHDWVLQSDANVRMQPGYLRALVQEMQADRADLATSLVVGIGEETVGAALENLQLCAFTAPATCAALQVAGISCVIGKSILLRRSDLERLGGLAIVKDVLAEDFVLGERYQQAGLRVLVSPTYAQNVNVRSDVRRFTARHSRWLKMRAVVSVTGFAADLLANPLPFALASWVAAGASRDWLWLPLTVALCKPILDAMLVRRTRGQAMALRYFWLSPVRDFLMAGIWCHALFSRHVEWRGARFRLRSGSLLEPVESVRLTPAAAPTRLDDQRHL